MWSKITEEFHNLCTRENRPGLIAAAPFGEIRLIPEQNSYLRGKLARHGLSPENVTALSLGLAYRPEEVEVIPDRWVGKNPPESRWNEYARAYGELNRALNRVSRALAETFHGLAEGATLEGLVGEVQHVKDYYPLCVSHRSVAEAAGLGWRGRHGLIVTPEFGPSLRLASVFLPGVFESPPRRLAGCQDCRACIEICPVLQKDAANPDPNVYRENCRRRIGNLALEDEVCGICIRRCREVILAGGPR